MSDLVDGHQDEQSQSSHPPLPPAPDPAKDDGVVPSIASPPVDHGSIPEQVNVFELTPIAALKMLCSNVDALVDVTGDIPPTPPISGANPLHTPPVQPSRAAWVSEKIRRMSAATPPGGTPNEQIDGVLFTPSPAIGSPEAHQNEPVHIIGGNSAPIHIQTGAIARKFYSKRPPPISTTDYLLRLHKYCPMSTAVYLATSLYINRLAMVDRLLAVTPRNVHRLLLGALRVAMKALEDLRYPHSRFAKVGGVSEIELGRLEISFCYLTSFELKVDEKMLQQEAEAINVEHRYGQGTVPVAFEPKLPSRRKRLSQNIVT